MLSSVVISDDNTVAYTSFLTNVEQSGILMPFQLKYVLGMMKELTALQPIVLLGTHRVI